MVMAIGALAAPASASDWTLTNFPGTVSAAAGMAVQADGRIVVAGGATAWDEQTGEYGLGQFALARYNADLSLDPSFGAGGRVTTAVGAESASANAVVVQGDGRIVVAGSAGSDLALARY